MVDDANDRRIPFRLSWSPTGRNAVVRLQNESLKVANSDKASLAFGRGLDPKLMESLLRLTLIETDVCDAFQFKQALLHRQS